jgi:hypothetical protein
VGEFEANEIEIEGTTIGMVRLLVAEGSLVTEAVIVTLLPIGTFEGAI